MELFGAVSKRNIVVRAARRVLLPAMGASVLCMSAWGQTQPASDPNALALLSQTGLALTSGVLVTDWSATGNAVGSLGESGTATLAFSGANLSRIDFQLQTGSYSGIRNDSNGPAGALVDPSGVTRAMPYHNVLTPAAWFSPLGWLQAGLANNAVVIYVASESRYGVTVDHLRAYRFVAGATTELVQRLSTFDLYLDSVYHLPFWVDFNLHPDDNASLNIPVEVGFTDYRSAGTTYVPYRIQRLINGGLDLDISVITALSNSGLSTAQFQLPQ